MLRTPEKLQARLAPLRPEPVGGASFRPRRLFVSILRRRRRFERTEKASGDAGDFIDGSQERRFIGLRRLVKTADLSHELKRSRSNLFVTDRRIEVEERFDIPAHTLPIARPDRYRDSLINFTGLGGLRRAPDGRLPSEQEKVTPAKRAPVGLKEPVESFLDGVTHAYPSKIDRFAMWTARGE
jgi:hypothetical protein